MLILFLYLFVVISNSSFGMEQPPRALAQVVAQKPFATREIYLQAQEAVCSGHVARLERILQGHTFKQKKMAYLLGSSMGSKQLDCEFMDCFVLLLQHGAPVNVATLPTNNNLPLHHALEEYPAYIKPLLMFGAVPTYELAVKIKESPALKERYLEALEERSAIQGNSVQSFLASQVLGKLPRARARERLYKMH